MTSLCPAFPERAPPDEGLLTQGWDASLQAPLPLEALTPWRANQVLQPQAEEGTRVSQEA